MDKLEVRALFADLEGKSLMLISDFDLDVELATIYFWITDGQQYPKPKITKSAYNKELTEFLSKLSTVAPMNIHRFEEICETQSGDFLYQLANDLHQIRLKLHETLLKTTPVRCEPPEVSSPLPMYDGRKCLLPQSYRDRLQLLLTSKRVPFAELFLV